MCSIFLCTFISPLMLPKRTMVVISSSRAVAWTSFIVKGFKPKRENLWDRLEVSLQPLHPSAVVEVEVLRKNYWLGVPALG